MTKILFSSVRGGFGALLGFVLCLGLTLAVFVVKEMICLNYRKLKPLRGR